MSIREGLELVANQTNTYIANSISLETLEYFHCSYQLKYSLNYI